VTTPVDADAETLSAICARTRRDDTPALRTPERTVTYHTLITDSYRAGNALRYMGVDAGDHVAIDTSALVRAVPAMLGAAQLGAVTAIGPAMEQASVALLQAPLTEEAGYDRLAVYGAAPAAPSVVHWEATMWSENPAIHPVSVAGDWPVLTDGTHTWTHAEVLRGMDVVGAPGVISGPIDAGERLIDGVIGPLAEGSCVEITA
jgi:Acyl-coenzyme A synthetases/AMP-(fatty) acid ligases